MTASIIIQILSIVMLMLLAVPGTQWIWKFGDSGIGKYGNKVIRKFGKMEIRKSEKRVEVNELKKLGWFTELSKIAAAIF